jgi:Kef-type K+ transport system membrane component KefB
MEVKREFGGDSVSCVFCICWNRSISRTVTHCESLCNRYGCCKHKDYQVQEYVDKLQIIFAPLFFAIIGAQVDLREVNLDVLYISGILIAIAVVTKLVGTGLPSMIFLKDRTKAMTVSIGMVSRGEVGLIVAGVPY